jgi:S1-C subfamily serine protease
MEIWVHRNGQYAGRFSESVIRQKIADGSLSSNDLAWDEAKSLWKPLSEFLASLPAETSAPTTTAPAAVAVKESAAESSAVAGTKPAEIKPVESKPVETKAAEVPFLASPVETKPAEVRRSTPPPLPSMAAPAAGPPPLPTVMPGPGSTIPAVASILTPPPEGEKIWSPYVAILGSIFLTPAFGGFIIWRNWLRMNRRRRAMVAAPWFWIGFVVVGLLFYSRDRLVWVVWAAYLVAWIAFSAYPQIRYVHTTFKRERMRSTLPLVAALVLGGAGIAAYLLTAPPPKTIPTLEPTPQQPTVTQIAPPTDKVFSADELRDMYKSSVLEVRALWKEKKSTFNNKENGANGTGVLLYNDAEYGLVATNWHVVEPSEAMTSDYHCGVRFSHDKDFADVEVVARAKNNVDLALLLVRLKGTWTPNQFPIRPLESIKEGEACIAIGNALGEGLSITSGIISRFDKVKEETLIRTSTPVSPGNSGGPLILCRGGALGGIVTLQSRITNVQNVNFATPAQYLLDKEIWDFQSGEEKAQQMLDSAIAQAKK